MPISSGWVHILGGLVDLNEKHTLRYLYPLREACRESKLAQAGKGAYSEA